ncbi:MAG: M20/M25/M40 family metallo-hydrolase [Zetaproteobacteria bacterium]|nr:M20/M25/M40 family metallo-hydrolase [Zetaproteobacteria bacterium]
MNVKSYSWVAMTLLIACQKQHPLQVAPHWIKAPYTKVFSFEQPKEAQSIFFAGSAGNLYLQPKAEDHAKQVGLSLYDLKHKGVFHIELAPNSKLISELPQMENAIGYISGEEGFSGSAWIKDPSPQQLQSIATTVHRMDTSSLPCGHIEWILPQTQLNITPTKHLHPIFDEWILIDEVALALNQVKKETIIETIQSLSAFDNRIHTTDEGLSIPNWIAGKFEGYLPHENGHVRQLEQSSSYSDQNNVVFTIRGRTFPEQKVILGAHMDSILASGETENAPGADDDASGIGVLFEIARMIQTLGWQFHRTIELHAYGAEEVGLLGSKSIAQSYQASQQIVAAMMQFDMVAYSAIENDTKIYLISKDTSEVLRRSSKDLLQTYLGGNYEEKTLISGTSDHKAWTLLGYPAVFPFENPFAYNPHIHTTKDTKDISSNHALAQRFAQLGLAFVAHMGGAIVLDNSYAAKRQLTELNGDIYLTIEPNQQLWDIWIGAPTTTTSIRICFTETENKNRCTYQAQMGEKVTQKNTRQIFKVPALEMTSSARVTVYAYDKKDQLIAYRVAQFTKK